jgi:hypothetical protein
MEQTQMFEVRVLKSLEFSAHILTAGGKYGAALQAAAFMGFPELVALLLEKGADPNIQGACLVIPRICD